MRATIPFSNSKNVADDFVSRGFGAELIGTDSEKITIYIFWTDISTEKEAQSTTKKSSMITAKEASEFVELREQRAAKKEIERINDLIRIEIEKGLCQVATSIPPDVNIDKVVNSFASRGYYVSFSMDSQGGEDINISWGKMRLF